MKAQAQLRDFFTMPPETNNNQPPAQPPASQTPPASPPAAPNPEELQKQLSDLQARLKAAQDEANAKNSELQKLQEAQKAKEREGLPEVEKLKADLSDAQQKAAQLQELQKQLDAGNAALKAQADAVRKELDIPSHIAELLDGMTPAQQLDYMARNRANLSKPAPAKPEIDAGAKGGSSKKPTKDKSELRAKYGIRRK